MLVVFNLFVLMLLTSAHPHSTPHSSNSGEEVGIMFPFRNGRFFIGLIVDTFWCGSGNVSRGLDELGPNWKVDSCCREHDLCNVFVEPGDEKYGYKNNRSFTVVSCECDTYFFTCLNSVNSWSSWAAINAYSITYPTCLARPIVCDSPNNDYDKNPCKGYRLTEDANRNSLCSSSENICKIMPNYVEADSQFKIYQMHLDKQKTEATIPNINEEHVSLVEPTAWQIFRRTS